MSAVPNIVLLFPGQGAQTLGMARDFHEAFASVREKFTEASEILGFDLADICFNGPEEKLNSTRVSQPALFVAGAAICEVAEEQDKLDLNHVSACAGLSLGEYTALYIAGAFDFATGVKLVERRGFFMQEACDARVSGMVSLLGATVEVAEGICEEARESGVVSVANLNAPGQVVISGEPRALQRAEALAKEKGVRKTIPLKVAGAYHSELMKPADEQLKEVLATHTIDAPGIPVYANVTAQPHGTGHDVRDLLTAQVLSRVRWQESMEALIAEGHVAFAEFGPGKVLAGLLKKINKEASCVSIHSVEALKAWEGVA